MDVLSDILELVRFRGCLYFDTRFHEPWGIEVPSFKKVARFHMAIGGSCWFRVGPEEPMRLNAGEMVVIPHGASHILSDHPDTQAEKLDRALAASGYLGSGAFIYGDGAETARLVCGHLEYDEGIDHPLLEKLPPYILIKGTRAREFAWFDNAIKLMAYEASGERPGNTAIVKKLTEVLFIHVVRVWHEQDHAETGFMNAISDPGLVRGLQAIHGAVEHKWSVADLARESGMSRTVFADRFRETTGLTPIQYLTHWRMQKAKRLLIDGSESVEEVAIVVGYDSPAAFSRVFKKTTGEGPGSFRRKFCGGITIEPESSRV